MGSLQTFSSPVFRGLGLCRSGRTLPLHILREAQIYIFVFPKQARERSEIQNPRTAVLGHHGAMIYR